MPPLLRILALALIPAAYAQGPMSVLIVVNSASSVSRSIGEYYARRRGIPQANLCRIKASQDEEISRDEFDRTVRGPITACLRQKQQVDSIRYLVTTLGVPLKIHGEIALDGDAASVDSELALLYDEIKNGRTHPLKGRQPNPYFRQRDIPFSHTRFPIYMVARLAAYDFAGARGMIDRSLAARNQGKFVLDTRGAGDSADEWLETAALFLPKDRVVLDESSKVLYGERGVIGYASWGSNDSNRKQRFVKFNWLPGAIATEFVSTNGRTFARPPADWNISDWSSRHLWFAGSPQTLTADYIADGASAATGHTEEPFLDATPRPDILFPAYYGGRNLAESFYLSIPYLSWQNILIGDPLMTLGPPPSLN